MHLLLRQQAQLPAGAPRADAGRDRRDRAADRQEVRRREEPAPGLGPLRRARLDAGHDGHDSEPWLERSDGRGAVPQDQQPALCLGLLSTLRPDVRRRGAGRAEAAGRGPRAVRDGDRRAEARAPPRRHRGHEADGGGSARAGRPVQGAHQGAGRQELPGVALGPADGRRGRRVRLVDERPRHRLPPQIQHPDRVGHRRQRAGDGVRQHRRRLRLRRRLHAQPGQWRQGVLRRVPDQRAGRRRGGRRADAGTGGGAEEADAGRLQGAGADPADARTPLQGRAGLRVHDRGPRRLHAADAQRQAHGDGGVEVLDGHGQGEADRLEDRGDAQPGRPARAAAGARVRRRRVGRGVADCDRAARGSRRRLRPDLPERGPRGDGGREGPARAARSGRDLTGRSARHDCRRRHPHGPRRRVLARGAGGPADGQGLRLRRRRSRGGLRRAAGQRQRPDLQGRRLDVDRRHRRQGLRRRAQDRPVRDHRRPGAQQRGGAGHREVPPLPAADEVVLAGGPDVGPHQCRHAGADGSRDCVRRRGHRPVPHRAHVLRGRPHRRDAGDDPRRDPRAAEGGARQAAAVPAGRLRRHLPGAQGLSRHDPLPGPAAARVPAALEGTAGRSGQEAARHRRAHPATGRAAARVQPDARLPRLPAGDRLPRDLGDAGHGPCSRPPRSCRRRASRCGPKS